MGYFSVNNCRTAVLGAVLGFGVLTGIVGVALADEPTTIAESAYMVDGDTGQVLYSKNPDERLPPASITKIMTMLIAMEDVEKGKVKLTDKVRTSTLAASMGGSQIYLKENEEMTLSEMLEAIAVVSANDACVAVGEFISGSEEDFVSRMNKRAKELGMRNTHFVNTNGLPAPEHYSSAHDIAIMSRELLEHKQILKFTKTWIGSLRDGKFLLRNTNELVKKYPGADGLKTGWTDEAGFCLSGTAKRNGMRLVAVVMRTPSNKARFQETAKLLDYGFRNFEKRTFVTKGKVKGEVRVNKGKRQTQALAAGKGLTLLVPRGEDAAVKLVPVVDNNVDAPVKKGEPLGRLEARRGAMVLGSVPLVAVEDNPKANFLVLAFRAIGNFLGSLFTFGRK